MKKVTLIMGALALVLGLSQCRKPNAPTINGGNGETIVQHITVGATCNGGNSKVNGQTAGNALKLTWDAGDKMIVDRMDVLSPPKFLTLSEGAGTASGKFSGTIEGVAGTTKLAFVHGGSGARWGMQKGVFTIYDVQFKDQNGKLEKTADSKASNKNSILDRLILFADNIDFIASSAAEYDVDLEVPYAILKLDLSAFGTTAGTTVSISAGGSEVASVTGITTNSKEVYVALPAAESREYTFSGDSKTAKVTWELNKNFYYTKTDGDGGSTGDAIVVAPAVPVLSFTSFSVTPIMHYCVISAYLNSTPSQQCSYGLVYSTSQYPTVENGILTAQGSGPVGPDSAGIAIVKQLEGLSANTYYVRAYAKGEKDEVYFYSEQKSFTITANK